MISEKTQKVIEAYFAGGNALGITTPGVLSSLMLAIKAVCEDEKAA